MAEQHEALSQKLRGHYGYYGITGNYRALVRLWRAVQRLWRRWLSRRSWGGRLTWALYRMLAERWPLPPPIVVHSVYRNAANP